MQPDGFGKTFTRSAAFDGVRVYVGNVFARASDVIPRVMRTLFERVAALPGDTSVSIKVGFATRGVRDLLRPRRGFAAYR